MKMEQVLGLSVAVALAVACLFPASAELSIERDVVFARVDGVDLKMDSAKPAELDEPLPGLVLVYGGGWHSGNKSDWAVHLPVLASLGYVTAAVQYRLAPDYAWPTQIDDVQSAVRYLRAHANELGLDPDCIGAVGASAGGHLALLIGLMDGDERTGVETENGEYSSKVQAVVSIAGPTDMRTWRAGPDADAALLADLGADTEGIMKNLFGTTDRSAEIVAEASPINYVDADDPPVLMFHGDADTTVPFEQSQALHAELNEAGVENELVVFEDATHDLGDARLLQVTQAAIGFLGRVLKPESTAGTDAESATSE
jgi:acetyl esterase/lipase